WSIVSLPTGDAEFWSYVLADCLATCDESSSAKERDFKRWIRGFSTRWIGGVTYGLYSLVRTVDFRVGVCMAPCASLASLYRVRCATGEIFGVKPWFSGNSLALI